MPILMVLVSAACASPLEPSSPIPVGTAQSRTGLVTQSGRVLDFFTGAAMGDAELLFRAGNSDDEWSAMTGSDGTFRIEIPPGTHIVTVNGELATTLRVLRSVTGSDILAGAGDCSAIYGFVTDARSGRPLPGATVSAGRTQTTDANGWYRMDFGCGSDVSFNTLIMGFTKPAYEPHSFSTRGRPRFALRMDVALRRK